MLGEILKHDIFETQETCKVLHFPMDPLVFLIWSKAEASDDPLQTTKPLNAKRHLILLLEDNYGVGRRRKQSAPR